VAKQLSLSLLSTHKKSPMEFLDQYRAMDVGVYANLFRRLFCNL
jgi:hypothetical protein